MLNYLALVASYLFNIVSALTAATVVYFFILKLSNQIIASLVTASFIVLIEVTKRSTALLFFKNLFQFSKVTKGLLVVILGLTSLSILFSYNGAKKTVESFTPPPALIDGDTLTAFYKNQLTNIENQIQEARKTKWKGTTTTESQATIKELTAQKDDLQAQIIKLENEAIADNKTTIISHKGKTQLSGYHFALFTFLLEILFVLCACYLEYYDYRSYADFAEPETQTSSHTNGKKITPPAVGKKTNPITKPSNGKKVLQNGSIPARARDYNAITATMPATEIDETVIQLAMKKVRNKITTANYRIRNKIGRKATNQRNLEAAEKELEQLRSML